MTNRTHTAALFLLFLAALAPPADAGEQGGGGGCDNYGTIVQVGIGNEYRCEHMAQYCDQGTGAGAGAGAGGPGQNEAGASATAGTRCTQEGDGQAATFDGLHVPDQPCEGAPAPRALDGPEGACIR